MSTPAAVAFCQILWYPNINPLRARGADNKGPARLSPHGERRSKEADAVFAVRRKRSQADFAPPTGRFVTSLMEGGDANGYIRGAVCLLHGTPWRCNSGFPDLQKEMTAHPSKGAVIS